MTLYDHGDFKGLSEKFYDHDANLGDNRIGNDRAASIRVDPGCEAILFRRPDFKGKSLSIRSDQPRIGRPVKADRTSSIRVYCK